MSQRQAIFEKIAQGLDFPIDEPILVGGNYRPVMQHGDQVHVSGQVPRIGKEVRVTGRVGEAVTLDQARHAACICVMRSLCILRQHLGSLDRIDQVLNMAVYTQCSADFTQLSEVADAASDLLHEVFGEPGAHVRTSVGVYQLPKNASVELGLLVAVHPAA